MANVLVTGASGFIGGSLTRTLRDAGHTVHAPARHTLDLNHRFTDAQMPRDIEVLVHCAAARDRAEPGEHRYESEVRINVDATARLFEWARRAGVPHVVHVSTISVLATRARDELLDEETPYVMPKTHPYALTKRFAEELALSLVSSFATLAIVRPGMTYGRAQNADGSLAKIARRVASGGRFTLAAPDGHRYAPVHVDDVVDVLRLSVESPRTLVVNVAGPDAILERAMLEDLASLFSVTLDVKVDESEPSRSAAPSTARVDSLFPGRVRTPWTTGRARTWSAC